MATESNSIRSEELVIYVGLAVVGAIRVTIQIASGEVWGGGATLGLALLVLGLVGLLARARIRRRGV